ncbi:MAG: hypothetical protein LPK02_00680, partial [Rhodobacterales bacterium]|nr:hypothetical protein [Rhodobacterales bacterium]
MNWLISDRPYQPRRIMCHRLTGRLCLVRGSEAFAIVLLFITHIVLVPQPMEIMLNRHGIFAPFPTLERRTAA